MSKRGNYSIEEVTALVEGYEELSTMRYKSWVQVRLLDMEQAYRRISPEYRAAVLLMGFMDMPSRDAAPFVQVSHATVARRYASGLSTMLDNMNGVSHLKTNRSRLERNRKARGRGEQVESLSR